VPVATAIAAHDGLVVEPQSMRPEVAVESIPDLLTAATAIAEADELAAVEYDDLTDIEKDVLRIAKNSLKKKRFEADIGFEPYTPMVEKIVGDCLAKFQAQKGYSKDAIIDTLKGLEEQRWIVTAERRTKEEILGDDIYQGITSFLEAYPGTHARDERVTQKLGITRNPFLKHVLVLDRFQLIKKYKFGKLWNFFAPSFEEDEKVAELVVVMYNDIVRQLIQLLIKNPGSTLVELAKSIIPPVYHGAIQYHLKRLEELGLVAHDGSNRVLNKAMLHRYNAVVCDELKIAA
jgi:predicted transcriptional regulator